MVTQFESAQLIYRYSLSLILPRRDTGKTVVIELSRYIGIGIKFARWQHPAIGRWARFSVAVATC